MSSAFSDGGRCTTANDMTCCLGDYRVAPGIVELVVTRWDFVYDDKINFVFALAEQACTCRIKVEDFLEEACSDDK